MPKIATRSMAMASAAGAAVGGHKEKSAMKRDDADLMHTRLGLVYERWGDVSVHESLRGAGSFCCSVNHFDSEIASTSSEVSGRAAVTLAPVVKRVATLTNHTTTHPHARITQLPCLFRLTCGPMPWQALTGCLQMQEATI